MPNLNVEIKARCPNPEQVRQYLFDHQADFRGIDLQTDTYFQVAEGRLKLREGNIENNLIFYQRANQSGPKNSFFQLVKVTDAAAVKEILGKSCGISRVVKKKREIYYLQNVKFHIDEVPGLGNFVEIEAGNLLADLTEAELRKQCDFYISELGIQPQDLIDESYSDLLLKHNPVTG